MLMEQIMKARGVGLRTGGGHIPANWARKRVAEPRFSNSQREIKGSLCGAGREREGGSGAGIEQEGAIFLLMGEEFGSGVAGEELRGKPKAPSSPCGRWSPNHEAEWEGGRFQCGGARGKSRETDFEQVLIDLNLVL